MSLFSLRMRKDKAKYFRDGNHPFGFVGSICLINIELPKA